MSSPDGYDIVCIIMVPEEDKDPTEVKLTGGIIIKEGKVKLPAQTKDRKLMARQIGDKTPYVSYTLMYRHPNLPQYN
jgi:hypothetical protein